MENSDTESLARAAADLAVTKKARDVVLLSLRDVSDVTDFFVLCTGDSDTHVKAIADGITQGLREQGIPVWKKEGYGNLQWILLDYVDVVVHVFQSKTREYYGLERLWGDAGQEMITETEST